MWSQTLLIWCTDNGSPVTVAGSNFPLEGGKGSNWEGGTRVPAFINGGLLPAAMRGKTLFGLAHVADFHATFSTLAGLPAADPSTTAPAPIDSIDQWAHWTGKTDTASETQKHDVAPLFQNGAKIWI